MPSLIVNGSSSSGNNYVLQSNDDKFFIIEAGVPYKDVIKSIGYKRSNIVGGIISHRHSDHAGRMEEYKGFPIGAPESLPHADTEYIPEYKWKSYDRYKVLPFSVQHDVPCYGYVVKHEDFGAILFATDCMNIPTVFSGIDWFVIEANYSDELIDNSDIDGYQRNRIIQSHMSLDYCISYLRRCHAEKAQGIILIHLSDRHSDEDAFKLRVQEEFGVPTYIADKGKVISLTKV